MNNNRLEHLESEQNGFDIMNSIDTFEFGIAKFPKEFERQWSDIIDKRFVLILLITFTFHFITALYFAINPPTDKITYKDIKKIQNQFVDLILKEPIKEIEDEHDEIIFSEKTFVKNEEVTTIKDEQKKSVGSASTDGMKIAGSKGGTTGARATSYDGGTDNRRITKDHISKEVSSKGLLGVLSGTKTSGEGAADILGEGAGDVDNVFNKLEGMNVSGAGSKGMADGSGSGTGTHGVKGSRTTSGGRIDNVIAGRGTAKSTTVTRKGSIVVSSISAVENEDGLRSDSRNSDDVSEVVNSHNNAIQYCYQRELKRNPSLKGKLVVRFLIKPNGKVSEVTMISSTLNNPRVERCVVNRIKRWDDFKAIDPLKGDAVFRQVYTFGY